MYAVADISLLLIEKYISGFRLIAFKYKIVQHTFMRCGYRSSDGSPAQAAAHRFTPANARE
jgi:hypothetical protein